MSINSGNDDVKKLVNYLKNNDKESILSDITPFWNTDSIYKWTNEKMNLYPKVDLTGKKVLTITSSGDHAIDAVLYGAKEIDSIDINIFCKYYSALKIAMIKKYDYNTFYYKMNEFTGSVSWEEREILDEISVYLTEEEISFWRQYIILKEQSYDYLFRRNSNTLIRNRYYCKENYNILKQNINDVNITYYDGDLIGINNILNDKSYDLIYLSNIIERIDTENEERDRIETIEKIRKLLKDNGIIYNYFTNCYFFNDCKIDDSFGKYYNILNNKFNIEYYFDGEICGQGLAKMILK